MKPHLLDLTWIVTPWDDKLKTPAERQQLWQAERNRIMTKLHDRLVAQMLKPSAWSKYMDANTLKHRAIGEDTGERYTHIIKGGTYRLIAYGEHKHERGDQWRDCVTYADVYGGRVYTTGRARWDGDFEIMPGPGYVNQG